MKTDRRAWVAGALVAATLLTGCGAAASSTTTTTATGTGAKANPVLDAYQKTLADKTATMTLNETVTGASAGPVTISGTGQVDFTTGAAQFAVTVPTAGTINMRLLKPMLYMQLPSADASALPAGKSWVSIDLDKLAHSVAGTSLAQLSNSADLGTNMLSSLNAVSAAGITTVGPATIGGVPTTEYSATIDFSKAAAQDNPQVRAALQHIGSQFHLTTVPVQVWIDAQGQVRQTSIQESLTVKGAPTEVQVTVGLSNLGAPVDVVPPPANETISFLSIPGAAASL
jgi:hypothetical protein